MGFYLGSEVYPPPMTFPEYDTLDATAMAALVSAGQVSPAELLEAAVERIEARNPELNAIVDTFYDKARAESDSLPDGPFKGVPFLLKDLKAQLAGTVTTNSTALRTGVVSTQTSVLVQRYQAAGVQILGKTNTPEFGIMGITEPRTRGAARNPWNLEHTPGGSSGGSGSAVAARMVPMAHGGDGGGSIRIPASCCGLFGLKPTRGRNTMAPFMGDAWGGFVQEHVLTHSVRDCAAMLDLTAIPTPGEPYGIAPPARPWLQEVGADPGKLRVAFTTDTLHAGETDPACKAAVLDAAKLLEALGHEVVEAAPVYPKEAMIQAYFRTVCAGIAWYVDQAAHDAGRAPSPGDFEPSTWLMAQIGWATTAPELQDSIYEMQQVNRTMAAFHADYDVMLSSTMAKPPSKIGELYPNSGDHVQMALLRVLGFKSLLDFTIKKLGTDTMAWTPNTQLFNQTGQPAASLPLFEHEGLPIGVQLSTAFGDEATLFRLSSQLEEARPWAGKRPPSLG